MELPILRSKRLDLIAVKRVHAPEMFAVLNDASLYQFTGNEPPSNVAALVRLYESWETRKAPDGSELWLNWVVSLRVSCELIGYVQASVLTEYTLLAWVIGSAWQHNGYAR